MLIYKSMLTHIREYIDFSDIDTEETRLLTNKNFVTFLKDNNIYDKFINNLQQEIVHSRGYYGNEWSSIETFCDDVDVGRYISDAFYWGSTPEGHRFWDRYDYIWYKYTLKHLRENINFDDYETDETIDSPLTDKDFVEFLKTNNIHDRFVTNLEKEANHRWNISTFCDDIGNRYDYISGGIYWSNTPEGHSFWSKYNNLWRRWVRIHQ